MDVTAPLNSTGQFTGVDTNGNPITVTNQLINLGWEYVWHCHLLGHEENDMMRPIAFNVPKLLPTAPVVIYLRPGGVTTGPVTLTWTDTTSVGPDPTNPANLGDPTNEVGFKIERATIVNKKVGTYSPLPIVLPDLTSQPNIPANGSKFLVSGQIQYIDRTATTGISYSYRVIAYNAAGNSTSSAVPGAPPALPNAAPVILTAVLQAGPQILLTWTDKATNETGFVIERAIGSGTLTFTTLATPGPKSGTGIVTYTDTAIGAGKTYTYRVKAVNAAGSSAYTNTASVVVPSIPAAPSNLTRFASKVGTGTKATATVTLTWRDNSTNETRFEIQRATTVDFLTNLTNITITSPVPPNSSGTNVTYPNALLKLNTTYYYRVRAVNISGASIWVNFLPITTPQ